MRQFRGDRGTCRPDTNNAYVNPDIDGALTRRGRGFGRTCTSSLLPQTAARVSGAAVATKMLVWYIQRKDTRKSRRTNNGTVGTGHRPPVCSLRHRLVVSEPSGVFYQREKAGEKLLDVFGAHLRNIVHAAEESQRVVTRNSMVILLMLCSPTDRARVPTYPTSRHARPGKCHERVRFFFSSLPEAKTRITLEHLLSFEATIVLGKTMLCADVLLHQHSHVLSQINSVRFPDSVWFSGW